VKLLSVILPIYNVEAYLPECLDSVFSQNIPDLEVICVNDGSTDNSQGILNKYKERHPEMIIHTRKNGGLSAARNSGIPFATGKYIYFLDSDDYLFPGVLQKMLDLAETNNLEVANFNVTKSDGNPYFSISDYPKMTLTGKEYIRKMYEIQPPLPPVPVWMFLYKRSFLEKYSLTFKEGIVLEDNHFTLRVLFLAERVQLLNIPIQLHRVTREGSETQSVTEHQVNSILFTARDLYRFYKEHNCTDKIFYDKVFQLYINVASKVLAMKRYENTYYTPDDHAKMKECLINEGWIMHCLLIRWNKFRWYEWYIDNSKSPGLKKNLRRLSKIYWKLFIK